MTGTVACTQDVFTQLYERRLGDRFDADSTVSAAATKKLRDATVKKLERTSVNAEARGSGNLRGSRQAPPAGAGQRPSRSNTPIPGMRNPDKGSSTPMSLAILTPSNQVVRKTIFVKEEAARIPMAFTPTPGQTSLEDVGPESGYEESEATTTGWDIIQAEADEMMIATANVLAEKELVALHFINLSW